MSKTYKPFPLVLDMPGEDQPSDPTIGLSVEEFNKIVEIFGSEMSFSMYRLLREALQHGTKIEVTS